MITLNTKVHGLLDYLLAIAFIAAPLLFHFGPSAATAFYVAGFAYLGLSLLTKYPSGVIKVIPFPAHGAIEAGMAASWIIIPWLFGFAGQELARNLFIIAGVGLLVVVARTNYRSAYNEYLHTRARHA